MPTIKFVKTPAIWLMFMVVLVTATYAFIIYAQSTDKDTATSTSASIEVMNRQGDSTYCVNFAANSDKPTVVNIRNCGNRSVTIRADKEYLPPLAADDSIVYDIPAGYEQFAASVVDDNQNWFGGVDFG